MKKNSSIRVRFAPTPRGNVHIVKLRAALINWLFAKQHNGTFVLRIDDLNAAELREDGVERLLQDLNWLGLSYNEGGIENNGAFGPYQQSERESIYKYFIDKLLTEGSAYRCFCTPPIIAKSSLHRKLRDIGCQNNCRDLSSIAQKRQMEKNIPSVIRLRVPHGEIIFDDMVQGQICFKGDDLGDFIIANADGHPTTFFAGAIDDSAMMISHVIRGNGFVSRTPRHIVICRALDLEPPIFGHLTPIADADGVPVSHDTNYATIGWFRREGFFPETVLAFAAQLAGLSLDSLEQPSLDGLLANFDISYIITMAPVFDLQALKTMNQNQINRLDREDLITALLPFLVDVGFSFDDERIEKIIDLYQDSIQSFAEFAQRVSFFNKNSLPISDRTALACIQKSSSQKVLWSFKRKLAALRNLDVGNFQRLMMNVKQETGIMGSALWQPIRIALTGALDGPDLAAIAELLGKERCGKFIENNVR